MDSGAVRESPLGLPMRHSSSSPRDPVALGGLEQVAERKGSRHHPRSCVPAPKGFEAAEAVAFARHGGIRSACSRWTPTSSLPRSGRARALKQERTGITLGNIIASPDKLSSKSLFAQAKRHSSGRGQGPRAPWARSWRAQIARVEELLVTYGTPVPVVFRSDNLTEVTLSTVGRLGTFSEKAAQPSARRLHRHRQPRRMSRRAREHPGPTEHATRRDPLRRDLLTVSRFPETPPPRGCRRRGHHSPGRLHAAGGSHGRIRVSG